MADNVTFQKTELATPASGTKVSTDEAASGHIQRVKLAYSADGVDTHVQADADGLLVSLGTHKDSVGTAMATTDIATATKAAIFGYTTSGGGSFQPVKVTPSGALTVEATITDGSGPVTVDGTVAATQSGTWNVGITGTPALPANASTEYTLATLSSNFSTALNGSNLRVGGFVDARQTGAWTVGVAGSVPVTDNGGSLTVDNGGTFAVQAAQSGTWNINNVAGTISLPTGAATETSVAAVAATASGSNLRVTPVNQTPISSSAAMVASVAASATNVTLRGAVAGRVGFSIYNDSTAVCYIKFGATASSTSFTVLLSSGSYYEYAGHGVYTGQVDAIWATATGSARVTSW